jgi:hypothetical protein
MTGNQPRKGGTGRIALNRAGLMNAPVLESGETINVTARFSGLTPVCTAPREALERPSAFWLRSPTPVIIVTRSGLARHARFSRHGELQFKVLGRLAGADGVGGHARHQHRSMTHRAPRRAS